MTVSPPGAPRPVTPVGLIAAQLAEVLELLDEGPVRQRVAEAHRLATGLDPYLAESCGPESRALRALAEETRRTDWTAYDGTTLLEQEMLSGHVEGQLLQMLVRLTGARQVLEIGMFTGYSALALAEALPDDGTVVACEIDAFAARVAQQCFAASPSGAKIRVRLGPAAATLEALAREGERFALVFVDADKAGYLDYLHALLDLGLLEPGGLVCVDNTLMQGQPWSPQPSANGAAIAAFNRAVAEDPRLDQVLVPLRDGLTLIRRRDG